MTDNVEFDNLNGPQKGLLADVLVELFEDAAALDVYYSQGIPLTEIHAATKEWL